jgi:hypothetical protein
MESGFVSTKRLSLHDRLISEILRNSLSYEGFLQISNGCETWSLTLREKHRLKVFEKRVLRIFGPKRDEVTSGWRKLHNEDIHNSYSSSSIIKMIKSRRMRWEGM